MLLEQEKEMVELRSKIEGIMRLREEQNGRITDEHFKKGSVRRGVLTGPQPIHQIK